MNCLEMRYEFVRVLHRMMRIGVKVDVDWYRNFAAELSPKIEELENKWFDVVGVKISRNAACAEVLYNGGYWPADGAPMTSKGAYALNKHTYAHVADNCPKGTLGRELLDIRLEWAKLNKLATTYTKTIIDAAERHLDCRVRTSYEVTGTKSSRLSSADPNLQNQPAAARGGFVAEPGNLLVSCDFSQAEVVLMYNVSNDDTLRQIVVDGKSLHDINQAAWGIDRMDAKRAIFALFYGGGTGTLVRNVGFSREEAQDVYSGFTKTYEGLCSWRVETIKRCRRLGYSETLFGHRRHLPDLYSSNRGTAAAAERSACNHVIQGSVADVIMACMVDLDHWIREKGGNLVMQVHDELVFEVPEASAATLAPQIAEKMTEISAKYLTTPIQSVYSIGKSYRELK